MYELDSMAALLRSVINDLVFQVDCKTFMAISTVLRDIKKWVLLKRGTENRIKWGKKESFKGMQKLGFRKYVIQ